MLVPDLNPTNPDNAGIILEVHPGMVRRTRPRIAQALGPVTAY